MGEGERVGEVVAAGEDEGGGVDECPGGVGTAVGLEQEGVVIAADVAHVDGDGLDGAVEVGDEGGAVVAGPWADAAVAPVGGEGVVFEVLQVVDVELVGGAGAAEGDGELGG